MAYTPTTWVDGSAPDIDATNLNHLENGVQAAAATADAAVPKATVTTNGDLIVATGASTVSRLGVGAAGTVLKGGTSPAYAAVVNADIDAAAAIAASKLASYPSDGTKFLAGDGTWKTASSTTYRKTTAKTVNNTITETDLLNGEITVGAGALGTTGVLRLTAWGDMLNNNALADGPRWKLKLGATTLLDTNVTGAGNVWSVSASRWGWRASAEIMNLGAANSQLALLDIGFSVFNGNAGAATFAVGEGHNTAIVATAGSVTRHIAQGVNTTAVDTTLAQALVLSVILPAASVNVEAKLLGAIVELI